MNQTPLIDEYSQHFREHSADPAKSAPAFFPNDAPHDADYSGQYLGPCWLTDLNQPDAVALFPTMLDEANSNLSAERAPCPSDSEKKQHDMLLPVPMENLLTLFYPPAPEAHHEDAEITSLEMFCSYYEQHEGYDSARSAKIQHLDHPHERHHSLSQFHDDAAIDGTNQGDHDLGPRHSLSDPHVPLHLSSAEFPKEGENDIPDRKPFLRSSRSKPSPAAIEPLHNHHQNSPLALNPMSMPMSRLNARELPATTRGRHAELSSPSLVADIRMMTALNDCYWKNGRKNLQCFPACPEHNDFYSMKMNNNKHSSVGVCRGPIYCHVFTRRADASSSPAPSLLFHAPERASSVQAAHSMKFTGGMGSASTGGSDHELFVLGRFERVPHRPMDDMDKNLADDLDAPPTFSSASEFEKFRFSCFQAVEMEERRVIMPQPGARTATLEPPTTRSTWFFLPDVWKVHPMLKEKRKATRSAPAQTFPFCFRVFVYMRNAAAASASGSRRDSGDIRFSCIAASASSFFELYSTRTVDRVKRKFWTEAEASSATAASARKRAR